MGSSQTRARTRVPCIGRQILNHCTTREAQGLSLYKLALESNEEIVGKINTCQRIAARVSTWGVWQGPEGHRGHAGQLTGCEVRSPNSKRPACVGRSAVLASSQSHLRSEELRYPRAAWTGSRRQLARPWVTITGDGGPATMDWKDVMLSQATAASPPPRPPRRAAPALGHRLSP